eukprot:1089654-Pyramimonas_sp.AAC.1
MASAPPKPRCLLPQADADPAQQLSVRQQAIVVHSEVELVDDGDLQAAAEGQQEAKETGREAKGGRGRKGGQGRRRE